MAQCSNSCDLLGMEADKAREGDLMGDRARLAKILRWKYDDRWQFQMKRCCLIRDARGTLIMGDNDFPMTMANGRWVFSDLCERYA